MNKEDFPNVSISNGRNRIIAVILAFVLGWIGGYKFYLGQWVQGLAFVLFCWSGLPFIFGIVEGVMMLAMTDEQFNAKFNSGKA